MRHAKEWQRFQGKIRTTFYGEYELPQHTTTHASQPKVRNYRDLDINYDTFIKYFHGKNSALKKFAEDYYIDDSKRILKISD
jgi:hypothetical protein